VTAAGLVNGLAYTLQNAFFVLTKYPGHFESIPSDYFDALRFVRHLPNRFVLLDELSRPYHSCNPAVFIGSKRVLVPSLYEPFGQPYAPTPESTQSEALWQRWQQSRFTEESVASHLAERAQVLLAGPGIQSEWWQPRRQFGTVAVYISKSTTKIGH
jgi:hypothetical protein